MSDLTAKQKQFCIEYLKDFNGTQAAIRAGYSENSAKEQASQHLTKLNIKEYLKLLSQEILGDDIKIIIQNVTFWENIRDAADQSTSDRLKASDLLGKYKAMFTDKIEQTGTMNITIGNDFEGI